MTTITYPPVPEEVLARLPGLDPTDPSTTPEPGKCVVGRPWGADVYGRGYHGPADYARRWDSYLKWLDAGGKDGWGAPCRYRATREPEHMCGNHSNSYRTTVTQQEKRAAADRQLGHNIELAKQLDRLGVVVDATSYGFTLRPDAAGKLINSLSCAQLDRDALRDLLGAVTAVGPREETVTLIRDTVARVRRHLDSTTDPEGA